MGRGPRGEACPAAALSACSETLLNMQLFGADGLCAFPCGRVPRRRSFCGEGASDPEAGA